MSFLGLAEKKTEPSSQDRPQKARDAVPSDTGDEAKKLAAAALAAVRNAAAAANGEGKVEVRMVMRRIEENLSLKSLSFVASCSSQL